VRPLVVDVALTVDAGAASVMLPASPSETDSLTTPLTAVAGAYAGAARTGAIPQLSQ
jgi:hypothetical protein